MLACVRKARISCNLNILELRSGILPVALLPLRRSSSSVQPLTYTCVLLHSSLLLFDDNQEEEKERGAGDAEETV